jgi:hypothetical protein
VDASFYQDSNAGAVGMVICDLEGKFIAARSKQALKKADFPLKHGIDIAISRVPLRNP